MPDKDMTREKIVLLYILQEAPGIRRSELIEIALGTLTADYFTLAEALNWLQSSDLIVLIDSDLLTDDSNEKDVAECYLTEQGEITLAALSDQLAESLRKWIKEHLDKTSLERRKRKSIEADYLKTDKDTYMLKIRHISDQGDSFSVELELPTEELARQASYFFKRDPERFYTDMLRTLLDMD